MIRILMLDLGETLVHEDVVRPNVPEALETLREFKTGDGSALELALVSDYYMPDPPATPAKIEKLFKDYTKLLDHWGLSKFFKPFKRHVTLSTNAGVQKPDRRIFELAVTRLGLDAKLNECLFITEMPEHISACRELEMATLWFAPEAVGGDFDDWSEAPLLVNQLIGAESHNLELGLKLQLASKYGMELTSMTKKPAGNKIQARAQKWHPVPNPKAAGKEKVHVPITVDVEIELGKKGRIRSVKGDEPDSETVADAAGFVESLAANEQISDESGPLAPGTTHQIETDKKGQKRLVRKRFSAI